MSAPKYQKPHLWRKSKDAECCIECEQPFKCGDKVFTDVAVNIHEQCLAAYGQTLKDLGLR